MALTGKTNHYYISDYFSLLRKLKNSATERVFGLASMIKAVFYLGQLFLVETVKNNR